MNTNEHEYWRKRELLPDDDAYLASVAKQVAAMRAAGEALDAITLNQRLTDTGKLAAAGGLAYIASLPDTVPSASNLTNTVTTNANRLAVTVKTDASQRFYRLRQP